MARYLFPDNKKKVINLANVIRRENVTLTHRPDPPAMDM
jgi:hypothetical protein